MRKVDILRKSKETEIRVILNLDGTGRARLNSGIGFLDHMLELFAFWGRFDLTITTKSADFKVDIHHANEDLGIVLGSAFKQALGEKRGIKRNAFAAFPMEKTTAIIVLDISGRPSFFLELEDKKNLTQVNAEAGYSLNSAEHFLEAFCKALGLNLNIILKSPSPDIHTTLEPLFKALGKALSEAVEIDPRRKGVPSTKGIID